MKNYIEKAPVTLIGGYRPDIDGLRAIAVLAVIFITLKLVFVQADLWVLISSLSSADI